MGSNNGRPPTFKYTKYGVRFIAIKIDNEVRVKLNTRAPKQRDTKSVMAQGRTNRMHRLCPGAQAVAKCFSGDKDHPPDKFNLKIGIRLATLRLLRAYAQILEHKIAKRKGVYEVEIDMLLQEIETNSHES